MSASVASLAVSFRPVAAATAQHEVVISNLADGTSGFAGVDDTADPATGNEARGTHTPGYDSGPHNRIVRTYDVASYLVNWNVNEAPATNVTLTIRLNGFDANNANVGWIVDQNGILSGCQRDTFNISDDKLTMTCVIGDVTEGSHGTVQPTVKLLNGRDATRWFATVEMTADTGTPATSSTEPDPYFVSEAPKGNWVKGAPKVSELVTVGGVQGYVALFPIGLQDQGLSKSKGSGRIEAAPITLYDHANTLPGSATLASSAHMTAAGFAGTPCGNLEPSVEVAMPSTEVSWGCSALGAVNNYPVVQMSLAAGQYDLVKPPTSNNGKPNPNFIVTGQIVYWIPEADLTFTDNSVRLVNTISANPAPDNVNEVDLVPIPVHGSSDVDETTIQDNSTAFAISNLSVGGGSTGGPSEFAAHSGFFTADYNLIKESTGAGRGTDRRGTAEHPTYRVSLLNGTNQYSTGFGVPGAASLVGHPTHEPYGSGKSPIDGQGIVHRGQLLYLNMQLLVYNSDRLMRAVHGCMTWDAAQIQLSEMPDFDVFDTSSGRLSATRSAQAPALAGPVGNLLAGYNTGRPWVSNVRDEWGAVIDPFDQTTLDSLGLKVEYALDPTVNPDNPNDVDPTPTGTDGSNFGTYGNVGQNSVECNNKAGRTWVDAADLQADADGLYRYNMVRVRTATYPWYNPHRTDGRSAAFSLTLAGRVGTNYNGNPTDVNHDNKALYLHTSRSFGPWDPATGNPTPTRVPGQNSTSTCWSNILWSDYKTLEPGQENNTVDPITNGWCNNLYDASAENNADPTQAPFYTSLPGTSLTWWRSGYYYFESDSGRVTVKSIRPNVVKSDVAGSNKIYDNGETVDFNFDLAAIGSDTEALVNTQFTDDFPNYNPETGQLTNSYYFEEILKQPDTPGASCVAYPAKRDDPNAPDVVTRLKCQLSQVDAENPDGSGLPIGLPGGWSDNLQVRTRVKGAVARLHTVSLHSNIAKVTSAATVTWDAAANAPASGARVVSFGQNSVGRVSTLLPRARNSGALTKALPAGFGPCVNGPDGNPLADDALAAWQQRCMLIPLDDDPSNLTGGSPTLDTSPDFRGEMTFDLTYNNTGSINATGLRFVDVLPFNGDDVEPASGTLADGVDPSTLGDGRTPPTRRQGELGLVKVEGAHLYYVTKDDPKTISRDANVTLTTNVWCTYNEATGATGNVDGSKAGDCPTHPYEITGLYIVATAPFDDTVDPAVPAETVGPDTSKTVRIVLDTENAACNNLYTNTFGVRTREILLPIRSNDVSAMVACPKYNLGNQVWEDVNNNGKLDDGERPIAGVEMLLFGSDDNGAPVDVDGDGTITAADAVATTTTDTEGMYLFGNLPIGDFIVGVAPSNWQSDKPLNHYLSSDATALDPNDDVDMDDNGFASQAMVLSGPVTLGQNAEPTGEEPSNNDNEATPDNRSNLTVDFGFYLPNFDLALKKLPTTVEPGQTPVIEAGDPYTWEIEVINQGTIAAVGVEIVDYLPSGWTLIDPDWTAGADGTATTRLPDTLKPGESTTVKITLQSAVNVSGDFENLAEVATATAVDGDESPIKTPIGDPISDIDSVSDTVFDNDAIINDEVDKTPETGDEDDHDIEPIAVEVPPQAPAPPSTVPAPRPPLVKTGAGLVSPATGGGLLLLAGGALVGLSRRRRRRTL